MALPGDLGKGCHPSQKQLSPSLYRQDTAGGWEAENGALLYCYKHKVGLTWNKRARHHSKKHTAQVIKSSMVIDGEI